MAKSTQISRSLKLYLDGKEVTKTVSELNADLKTARKELRDTQIGSDEYRKALEKVGTLKSMLNEHKAQLKSIEQTHESLASKAWEWIKGGFFNKIGFDSFDSLKRKLIEFRDMFNQRESSAANLKALTGLDDSSIKWLTEQASQLSTSMDETGLRITQSSQEILDAYMLVGSAKPELLSNKEALNAVTIEAMRLSQAAKMDLNEAVNGVTLAMNQYGASAEEAARYVNVLAAGSKAGAADVQAQTAAIIKAGVAASTAGIPIEQLVGSIETLAEKGIKSEVAGTGLKTFFLKLETLSDDCRPSVVGLQTALENLQNKGMSTEDMMKTFGEGTYTVAQAMISSADSFRQYTEAVTDTNTAIEQAAINSDTAAAKQQQLANKVNEAGMALWESLAPAFNVAMEGASGLMDLLTGFVSVITRNIELVGALVAVWTAYTIKVRYGTAIMELWRGALAAGNTMLLTWKNTLALCTTTTNLSNVALARFQIQMKSAGLATQVTTAAVALGRAAWSLLTLQFHAAANAMRLFTVAIASNPIGMLAVGLTAVLSLLPLFNSETEEATAAIDGESDATNRLTEAQKALNDVKQKAIEKVADEKTRIEELNRILHDSASSYDEKRKALAELQSIVPNYQASLSREGKILKENAQAIEDYIRKLDKMAMAEAIYDKIKELNAKIAENETNLNLAYKKMHSLQNLMPEQYETKTYYSPSAIGASSTVKYETTAYRNWKKEYDKNLQLVTQAGHYLSEANDEKNVLLDYLKTDAEVSKYYNQNVFSSEKLSAPATTSPSAIGGKTSTGNTGKKNKPGKTDNKPGKTDNKPDKTDNKPDPEVERQKKVKENLEKIELDYEKKVNDLKERYRNGNLKDETEYKNKLEDLALERLKRQLEVEGLSDEQATEISGKIKDIYIKHMEDFNKVVKATKEAGMSEYEETIKRIDEQEKEALDVIDRNHELGILNEEKYHELRKEVQERYAKERKEAFENSDMYLSALETVKSMFANADYFKTNNLDGHNDFTQIDRLREEIKTVREAMTTLDPDSPEYAAYEQYLDDLNGMLEEKGAAIESTVSEIGTSLGTALGNAIMGNKDGVKEAFKSLLNMVLDYIEKLIEATMLVPVAEAIVPGVGWAKAAESLAKIAAVKIAFAALKAAISNFDVGGYTGEGKWNEPAGIVHRGEFVANRFAVQNPAVRPILDLIDSAQRSGNIRQLSREDLAAVSHGFSNGGYTSPSFNSDRPISSSNTMDKTTQQLIMTCTAVMRQVKERFDKPIIAHTTATGKYGTMEAEELAVMMHNNGKRTKWKK